MQSLKQKWLAKKSGVQVGLGQDYYLTNLRFADDLLLVGRPLKQARSMLEELEAEVKKAGLEIHLGKTKIMNNDIGSSQNVRQIVCNCKKYEVLGREDSTMYLGLLLSLHDAHK